MPTMHLARLSHWASWCKLTSQTGTLTTFLHRHPQELGLL